LNCSTMSFRTASDMSAMRNVNCLLEEFVGRFYFGSGMLSLSGTRSEKKIPTPIADFLNKWMEIERS
jgi:hypothetical protein